MTDEQKRVRIVAVCSFFPLPVDRGDPLRVLQLLDALASDARFAFSLVVVKRPETTPQLVGDLEARLGSPVVALERPIMRGGTRVGRALTWGRALVQQTPNWVLERSPRTLRRVLKNMDADVVWYLGEAAARFRAQSSGGLQVWDKANVIGASASATWVGRHLRSQIAGVTARRYEGRLLAMMDRVVVTNETEAARLADLYGRRADAVMPSTVALDRSIVSSGRGSKRVGWLGNLDYTPNADGLAIFLESSWPTLRRDGYSLDIAGPGTPSPRVVAALRTCPEVTHLGFVDDLPSWMQTLSSAVVPLWAGGGTKLKTLTLLASGVPVVGTSDAFEGVDVAHGVSAFVAEGPEDLAAAIVTANSLDADHFSSISAEARAVVSKAFDPQTVANAYADALFTWARGS